MTRCICSTMSNVILSVYSFHYSLKLIKMLPFSAKKDKIARKVNMTLIAIQIVLLLRTVATWF